MWRRTVFDLLSGPQCCIPHHIYAGIYTQSRLFLHKPKQHKKEQKKEEIFGQYRRNVDPLAVERRNAFQQYMHSKNAAFVGTETSTLNVSAASSDVFGFVEERQTTPKRHLLETIEVRPPSTSSSSSLLSEDAERKTTEEGNYDDNHKFHHSSSQTKQQQQKERVKSIPGLRGQRDLQQLQRRVSGHTRAIEEQKLNEEYQRSLLILRDILAALQGNVQSTTMNKPGKSNKLHEMRQGSLSEAVRFERLHQLRDTTNRLTTAHFIQLSNSEILKFLDIIARIVVLAQQPHITAHGYVVRQAVRALFLKGGDSTTDKPSSSSLKQTFLGIHYYNLLRVMLSLPSSETVEVLDGNIITSSCSPGAVSVSLEEFCVRRLYYRGCDTLPESSSYLNEIGPFRAVRVIAWCMRCAESPLLIGGGQQQQQGRGGISLKRSSFGSSSPPRSVLRIPFGVGKEYTQSVLSAFSPHTSSQPENTLTTSPTPFRVTDLATLCSAIVFYEITTMEALEVLVQAAPMCAMYVDELSGHQLSCVMLAYATLKYHGDLSKHPISQHNSSVSHVEGKRQEGNFFLLLGARAGMIGEGLREDDAARVLRALDITGIEHDGLRRSLESSMRMRGLQHRSLLVRG